MKLKVKIGDPDKEEDDEREEEKFEEYFHSERVVFIGSLKVFYD
jgi:hypothetical protein